MKEYVADLHVHSHHSRATSKDLTLEGLYEWACIKGIDVVGTGDFTHPAWYQTLQTKLKPRGNGFFSLIDQPAGVSGILRQRREVHFCLTVEVCCIYHYEGRLRKSHHVICVPDLETAGRLNQRLGRYGNLAADGRPILKCSARDLLEIVLESSPDAHLIPAHIWTPWFAILGSRSGYNSVKACFRDLTSHIFALETGLSSDPAMNWCWTDLDRYTMISNSDAHSPRNLGREANVLTGECSYQAMFEAFKTRKGFAGTLEFFPEEGKYHLDGHRNCQVCFSPEETWQHKGICPVCQQPLTVGVLHRIRRLADRTQPVRPKGAPSFMHIVPLPEILSEIIGKGVKTKTVTKAYTQAIHAFGNEFDLLRHVPLVDIAQKLGPRCKLAIQRLRNRQVFRKAGYDGVYGTISLLYEPMSNDVIDASRL